MNLTGLMLCRNEAWVLGLSARVALGWCDRLVILDHASIDGTRIILRALCNEYKDRIGLMRVVDTDWAEMEHRQMLLRWARENLGDTGATHIAIIDADELLTGNAVQAVRDQVAALRTGQMLTLPLYNLRSGMNRYHLNGVWGQRVVSVAFKDVNTTEWKGDKFHSREPDGVHWQPVKYLNQGAGGIMHLWGASERRLIAKHALYKCIERLRWPDKPVELIDMEYSQAVKGRPWMRDTPDKWTFGDVPASWLAPYTDWMIDHLHLDMEPWQEAETRRLVSQHGRERFAGLDLFGVA